MATGNYSDDEIICRDLLIGDLVELESHALFPVENMVNKPMIVQKTFEGKDGIIGSILVNRTVELSAIFADVSKISKIKVMMRMFDILYQELTPLGYRDLHAFITDEKFVEILLKHFSFERAVGQALVRRY